jgi:hypothetical protein
MWTLVIIVIMSSVQGGSGTSSTIHSVGNFPLSKNVMMQQKRLLIPAWSKGPYKPTASTKSALIVLGCELGQTTAP